MTQIENHDTGGTNAQKYGPSEWTIPEDVDLAKYVPADLIARWHENGGALTEEDFCRNPDTSPRKNEPAYRGPLHTLSDQEFTEWRRYKINRSAFEMKKEREVEKRRSTEFKASPEGVRLQTEMEQKWERERIERLLALGPLLAFLRHAVPGHPEFIAWVQNKGLHITYDYIVGNILEDSSGREPPRLFKKPLFNTIGGGFYLTQIDAKERNMARVLGVADIYADEETMVKVAIGFLDLEAKKMKPKDLLRGYVPGPFKRPELGAAEASEPWAASLPELNTWNDENRPKPPLLSTKPTDPLIRQVADSIMKDFTNGDENFRIALSLLNSAFRKAQDR